MFHSPTLLPNLTIPIHICDRKSSTLPVNTESRVKPEYVSFITHYLPSFFSIFLTLPYHTLLLTLPYLTSYLALHLALPYILQSFVSYLTLPYEQYLLPYLILRTIPSTLPYEQYLLPYLTLPYILPYHTSYLTVP